VVFVNDRLALHTAGDYERLVHQVRRDLVDWIDVWNACHRTARFQAWIGYLNFLGARGSMRWLLLPLALLGMLAIPVPYWPQRDCTVEPAVRNFVASPIDGRVMQAHVRPGDVVQRGQLLAKLDDEQLQWALSSAHAELETANKKRDSALATRAAGDLRLAQLEQERLTIELDALERQLEQLELTSPVDGIIVQGDWYQSDGIPVNRGDTLFEIASLDTMRIETHLSSEDLSQIKVGDRATVRVDAAPGKSWPELLSRIDPRGQTLDSRVVFPADMDVANVDDLLRPGMKGSVRISAGSRSIGWLLFHRPYMWAMKKIFW
jgi:biotin carboxyl carrier protein